MYIDVLFVDDVSGTERGGASGGKTQDRRLKKEMIMRGG